MSPFTLLRRSLLAAPLLAVCAPALAQPTRRRLVVDAGGRTQPLKALRGVSGAPDPSYADPKLLNGQFGPRPVDVRADYRRARVNLVRTHDCYGASNIDANVGPLPPLPMNFPGAPPEAAAARLEEQRLSNLNVMFRDMSADPANPASYHWGPTDALVRSIREIGADVLFRLGRDGGTTAPAPADLAKYAEIVRHIVLHYNKGWGGGGFQNAVKYWEIWNEPDLGQIWWRGTPEEFYALYASMARAVRAADPRSLVGGPTIALINEPTPYREGFLAYARDHRLPLDFYTWHWYSSDADNPYDFVRTAREMRRLLDGHGFTKTLNVLDEWNRSLGDHHAEDPMIGAAFVASSRLYMQDGPIDLEAYYRADSEFLPNGKPNKTFRALEALGRLAGTPARLTVSGADDKGFAVNAARSDDGRLIHVLISNYEVPAPFREPRTKPAYFEAPGLFKMLLPQRPAISYGDNRGYDLSIAGLARGASYQLERRRLSSATDFDVIESRKVSGPSVQLAADMPPPSLDLVTLRRV